MGNNQQAGKQIERGGGGGRAGNNHRSIKSYFSSFDQVCALYRLCKFVCLFQHWLLESWRWIWECETALIEARRVAQREEAPGAWISKWSRTSDYCCTICTMTAPCLCPEHLFVVAVGGLFIWLQLLFGSKWARGADIRSQMDSTPVSWPVKRGHWYT